MESVPLEKDQVVKIIAGAFAGFSATVQADPKGATVRLQTTIFGKPTPIILPRDHVAAVTQ
jgi:transcription antitermination factor NusG